jgi:energy-converting hydrogenase Eha subunit E
MTTRSVRLVLGVQAAYYFVSGVWPIVSLGTFEYVTGPKTDDWLVHTVGLLLAAIGLTIATAIRVGEVGAPICVLAFGTAFALAAIEVFYVAAGVIGSIYLLDAAIELALAFALAWTLVRARAAAKYS